jgi:hypothetical protein
LIFTGSPDKKGIMTDKNKAWKELITQTPEAQFDLRLTEKRIDDGFSKPADLQNYLKALPEETEFDVVDIEAVESSAS